MLSVDVNCFRNSGKELGKRSGWLPAFFSFFSSKCCEKVFFFTLQGVLHGSVVKCLTLNSVVLGSSCNGSSGFFVGLSFGKTLQSPRLVLVKPWKDMNIVNCHCNMTVESGVKNIQAIN